MEAVRTSIKNLNWTLPTNIQQNAIRDLLNIDDDNVAMLIDPNQKYTWENATLVIEQIGYPKNSKALPGLLWLLQDINWPGALKAIEILKSTDKLVILPLVEQTIIKAYEDEDYMWLGGIKRLIEEAKYTINDFSNVETYKLLNYSDF